MRRIARARDDAMIDGDPHQLRQFGYFSDG